VRMNKMIKKLFFIFLILIITPLITVASQFMSREGVVVPRADSVFDDIYLFSNQSEIYGYVDGDISAFSYDIETNGHITGSVNIFAYKSILEGEVDQSSRLFGYQIDYDAHTGRNVLAFAQRIDFGRKSVIGRDLTCGAERVNFDGVVHGNADINADVISVSGTIDGDLKASGGEISLISPAIIKGDFICTSTDEPYIDDDVVIEGQTEWTPPKKTEKQVSKGLSAVGAVFRFLLFIMALVTGLAMIILFRRHTDESAVQIQKRFWHTLAIGFLAWVIFIGGSLILLVLIIGIPLSILLVTLGMVLFYVGKVYVSIFIGRLLIGLIHRGKRIALGWELLLGLIILTLIFRIPGLGTLVYIVTFVLGTGAAITGYLSLSRSPKSPTAPTPPTPVNQ
jgi:cytoskeletal protein CcmA (bactofilin family)